MGDCLERAGGRILLTLFPPRTLLGFQDFMDRLRSADRCLAFLAGAVKIPHSIEQLVRPRANFPVDGKIDLYDAGA